MKFQVGDEVIIIYNNQRGRIIDARDGNYLVKIRPIGQTIDQSSFLNFQNPIPISLYREDQLISPKMLEFDKNLKDILK